MAAHLLTADPQLADELTRLALLAAVPVSSGSSTAEIDPGCRLVLAGAELLPLPSLGRPLLVVTTGELSVELLEAAMSAGARGVARLPLDESRVVQELIGCALPERSGRLVGVVGGSGGLGASTFAAACALAAAPALLVDCDPFGAGLDVLLGLEVEPGPRWSELAAARGRVSAEALRDALPRLDEVAVLAHDGAAVPSAALTAVIGAGVGDGGTVVLDLPRGDCAWLSAAGQRLDDAVLVVADDVAGVLAAGRIAAALRTVTGRVSAALLRGGGGLTEDLVARSLALPVVTTLPVESRARTPARPSRAWLRAAREVLA